MNWWYFMLGFHLIFALLSVGRILGVCDTKNKQELIIGLSLALFSIVIPFGWLAILLISAGLNIGRK